MSEIKSYRDLTVWQKSMELTEEIYKITHKFPKEERYSLSDQIRRSAVSVPSNIAEGWGRGRTKEYLHHLAIAKGSLMEMETQLILAVRLAYTTRDTAAPLWDLSNEVGRMLNGLKASLERRT